MNRRSYLLQYGLGFACGLALGLWCMDLGMRQALEAEPDFPVITSEPSRPTPVSP